MCEQRQKRRQSSHNRDSKVNEFLLPHGLTLLLAPRQTCDSYERSVN